MDYMCRQPNFFKNPNKLPLNELQLEVKIVKRKKKIPSDKDIDDIKDTLDKNYDVRIEKKPALDAYWIQKEHSYCKYQPYYSEVSREENELFISKNKLFKENLNFLLQCTYHQFWNYIIFEPRVKAILKSFIFNPVHLYELKHLDGEYLDLYNDIYRKIANIYLRMLTFKESNIEFMSEDTATKLIEKHKLLNFAEITNILMLYDKTNQKLIFKIQELFFNDKQKNKCSRELNKILNHFILVFEMVTGQICGFEDDAVKIPVGIRPKPAVYDPYWIEEVVTYLLDTATVLNSLVCNCPLAVEMAISLGLPYRLTDFYSRVYPTLYKMMHDRAVTLNNWPDLQSRILDQIAMGRNVFVDGFHAIVTSLIDNIIQTLGDNEKQDAFTEKYLSIISSALEDEFFIFDYHNTHNIDLQLQTLSDFHPQIDHMRINYILECLSTMPTLEKLREMKLEDKPETCFDQTTEPSTSRENGYIGAEPDVKRTYSDSEIQDLTKSIMDTLPHLGDGFIRECLKSYNYNTAEVISAILDENLPPHLMTVPKDLLYVPPEPEPEQPVLSYKGKKPDYKDAGQLLNDKSEIEDLKNFVLKVSNVSYDMYDDEYDDRYDDEPQLKFYDKSDDTSMYEHMGKRFEEYELVSDPSDSYSEEEDEAPGPAPNPRAFCEDPAVIRARKEANRGGGGGGRGRSFNVVGKPKGQGQEKSVLHSREKKNVQKSSRANHSRKSGAQWKRNKGMIPS